MPWPRLESSHSLSCNSNSSNSCSGGSKTSKKPRIYEIERHCLEAVSEVVQQRDATLTDIEPVEGPAKERLS